MSDEDINPNLDDTPAGELKPSDINPPADLTGDSEQPSILKADLDEAVQEALLPMKDNMDRMAKQRDEALAKVQETEQKLKDAEIQQLKDSGKLQEATEQELAQSRARSEILEKRNIELTRDKDIGHAFSEVEFANARAANNAERIISDTLIRNETGDWVDKRTGKSIEEAVQAFIIDPENDFLLKAKKSSGGGNPAPGSSVSNTLNALQQPLSKVLNDIDTGKIQRKGKSLHRN